MGCGSSASLTSSSNLPEDPKSENRPIKNGSIKNGDPNFTDIERIWSEAKRTIEVNKVGQMEKNLIVKRRGWKCIRIFVSSTFRDFHQEREILVKKVFPDLRAWCESRRLYLIDVDLRWGVPKDFTSESTLRACLGEIDRCYQENVMPFFLNMTSDRIGWIPISSEIPDSIKSAYKWVNGLSITEMEIMHGAYRKDNPNALFLLRDPSFLDEMEENMRSEFIDNQEIAPCKLQILKKMISDRFPAERVINYKVRYEGFDEVKKQVKLAGLDDGFTVAVFNFFKKRILKQYPMQEGDTNPFEIARDAHEAFFKSRCDVVIGRDDIINDLIDQMVKPKSDVPTLLVAGPGSGKTSVIAKLADIACMKALTGDLPKCGKKKWKVFYHFVGAVPGSTELLRMLRRLLHEIKAVPDHQLPSEVDSAAQLTCGILNKVNIDPIVIIIDALNQMDEDNAAILVNWVPRKLSPWVRCIFSMINDTQQHQSLMSREPKPTCIPLEALTLENRKAIVNELLGKYNKQLDTEQMDSLLSKNSSENPLWLSIACEELRVFGRFREISDKISQLADGLLKLEDQILGRFEVENGGKLLVATLCLLEASARGLLETELLAILGEDVDTLFPNENNKNNEKYDRGKEIKNKEPQTLAAYKWTEIYRALRSFLRPFGESGEGRLDFYHRSLSKAIRKRYFSKDKSFLLWWQHKLADFFENCSNIHRKIEEYPVHLISIKARSKLETFLTDWNVFDVLYNYDYSFKLLSFWRQGSKYEHCQNIYRNIMNELEISETNKELLGKRFIQVANLLVQAGQYDAATEMGEIALKIEDQDLGARPMQMAEILQIIANTMDEKMRLNGYMYASQIPSILLIIKNFQRCIDLRIQLPGDENKIKTGKAYNRLAFYYQGVLARGTCDEFTREEGQQRAMSAVEKGIQIFKELNDEARMADCITTKGVISEGSEQIKAYKEAEEILLRTVGRLHVFVDRLFLNIGIYYEENHELELAFDYFYTWFKSCRDLYGINHIKTKRPIDTLNEPNYIMIAQKRQIEIPVFNQGSTTPEP